MTFGRKNMFNTILLKAYPQIRLSSLPLEVGNLETIITDIFTQSTASSNYFELFAGDTRLGLMWSCMTLYNRPQVCFTPELQPEWLLALICIFVGCICITTTIILLASSHWDRNVVPYARWVGFTASKWEIF